MIPYGRQEISDDDINAVVAVLRSDFLTQGPVVPAFESAVASYCGGRYAVATNSATSALHIACLALGVGPNDWVWTTPITFVASANCALYCGARVDFVDIDPLTFNMSLECLSTKLAQAERNGLLPKVLIPVHMAGQSCDMQAIHELSVKYGFKIIEDASHAIGGKYKGEPIGNCLFSDITVFSFHPVKIITTGEGGMAITNQSELASLMRLLGSHGVTRDLSRMTHKPDGPWYYQQVALGFNYRMTDIQAALGLSQISRLDNNVDRRNKLAKKYDEELMGNEVSAQLRHTDVYSAFHLYIILLQAGGGILEHGRVFEELKSSGVGVNVHYIPVHTQPYYRTLGFNRGDFPNSEKFYASAISLPMFPALSEIQQDKVIYELKKALRK